jgi:hypothetical protein
MGGEGQSTNFNRLTQAVAGGGEGGHSKTKEGRKNAAKVKKRGSGGG